MFKEHTFLARPRQNLKIVHVPWPKQFNFWEPILRKSLRMWLKLLEPDKCYTKKLKLTSLRVGGSYVALAVAASTNHQTYEWIHLRLASQSWATATEVPWVTPDRTSRKTLSWAQRKWLTHRIIITSHPMWSTPFVFGGNTNTADSVAALAKDHINQPICWKEPMGWPKV